MSKLVERRPGFARLCRRKENLKSGTLRTEAYTFVAFVRCPERPFGPNAMCTVPDAIVYKGDYYVRMMTEQDVYELGSPPVVLKVS